MIKKCVVIYNLEGRLSIPSWSHISFRGITCKPLINTVKKKKETSNFFNTEHHITLITYSLHKP